MATISNLEENVQSRLEEDISTAVGYGSGGYGSGGYGGSTSAGDGVFWSVQNEIRPALVEAMFEATLITGEPQVRSKVIYTVPAATGGYGGGGYGGGGYGEGEGPIFTPLAMPSDAIAILRVEGPGGLPVRKLWIWDLDKHYPGWETSVGDEPLYWVPFGLTQWGIVPNLTSPVQVILDYVQIPVNAPRPYTGAEPVPFQEEYQDAFEDYAQHVCQLKEAGAEFEQSFGAYNRFLAKMSELSNFAYRKNSLRFTRAVGAPADISEIRVR